MCRTIPMRRRDDRLAVFVEAYDAGFMAGLERYDACLVPEFDNDVCRQMWFEGWNLAKQLLADPEV